MSTYRTLKGYNIKSFTTNPTNLKEGQIWYNSTQGGVKVSPNVTAGAWSSGANIPKVFQQPGSSRLGTQNAMAIYGAGPYPATSNETLEYDGSSWTAGGDMNTARTIVNGSTGTLTAALAFGGFTPPPMTKATEHYDGTSWTNGGNLSGSAKYNSGGSGTQTAALSCGGNANPPFQLVETEEYDGSSWTAGGNLNTGRTGGGSAGTQTASLYAGGTTQARSEEYNGSSWTEGNDLSKPRRVKGGGFGTQTAAIMAAGDGYSPADNTLAGLCEQYDGTSYSTLAQLGSNLYERRGGGAGTTTAGILAGGGPGHNLVEEWNNPSPRVGIRELDVT